MCRWQRCIQEADPMTGITMQDVGTICSILGYLTAILLYISL